MKKKLTALFTLLAAAASLTACGGNTPAETDVQTNVITAEAENSQETEAVSETAETLADSAAPAETEAASDAETTAAEAETAAETEAAQETNGDFSFDTLSADSITESYSGAFENGELTFAFFTHNGRDCAAFTVKNADGTALVSAGSYTKEAYSEDGYDGSIYTFDEVFAGEFDSFSFAEGDGKLFIGIFGLGSYESAAIDAQTAASRLAEAAALPAPAQDSTAPLSLASLSAADIYAGAHGVGEDGSELTCAFFKNPENGEDYIALTFRNADGTSEVFAGSCTRDIAAEEEGEGTVYSINNIYADNELYFGISSCDGVWIIDVYIRTIYESLELDSETIVSRLAEDYNNAIG